MAIFSAGKILRKQKRPVNKILNDEIASTPCFILFILFFTGRINAPVMIFLNGTIIALPLHISCYCFYMNLVSVWLVRRFNNRRAISVFCSPMARISLIIIGCVALYATPGNMVSLVLFFLFSIMLFHPSQVPAGMHG